MSFAPLLPAEIPGQTTRKTTTTLKMPDWPNHVDAKPPFSASNYKKVTHRPTTPEDEQQRYPQNTSKMHAKPTKTSVEHILRQGTVAVSLGGGENLGSRQTHLIRSESKEADEELESLRDVFGSTGQSMAASGIGCWLLCILAISVINIIIQG